MIEGSGSGSIPLTNGSGSGSRSPKAYGSDGSGFGSVSATLEYTIQTNVAVQAKICRLPYRKVHRLSFIYTACTLWKSFWKTELYFDEDQATKLDRSTPRHPPPSQAILYSNISFILYFCIATPSKVVFLKVSFFFSYRRASVQSTNPSRQKGAAGGEFTIFHWHKSQTYVTSWMTDCFSKVGKTLLPYIYICGPVDGVSDRKICSSSPKLCYLIKISNQQKRQAQSLQNTKDSLFCSFLFYVLIFRIHRNAVFNFCEYLTDPDSESLLEKSDKKKVLKF